jgi:SPP1 gp7 family putative phage head morphogenesis protein
MMPEVEHICTYAAANRYDPTHTTALRNAFVRDMKARFAELVKVVRLAVDKQDCFGLKERRISTLQMNPPGQHAFSFLRDPEKIDEFMKWLQQQVDRGLLTLGTFNQIGRGIENEWTNTYILDSYKRGLLRAQSELRKAGVAIGDIEIGISMGTPIHLDRVGVLFTRVFSELKGITAEMERNISRILAQGMINGEDPITLANKLVAAIDGTGMGTLGMTDSLGRFIPALTRAKMMARTEMIRAFHLAAIQEYRNWGIEGVIVMAEWMTAQDEKVCSQCLALQGKIFSLDEIEPMIPLHPNCRCIALPYIEDITKFYNING